MPIESPSESKERLAPSARPGPERDPQSVLQRTRVTTQRLVGLLHETVASVQQETLRRVDETFRRLRK